MAGSKSDYLEGKVLDHVLGNTAYSAPGTTYVALYTATPGETNAGTEVSGGSYGRVSVTNNTTNWPNAVSSVKHNGIDITFTTATGSWGTVTSFGILDAS